MVRKVPMYTCVITMGITLIPFVQDMFTSPGSVLKQTILGFLPVPNATIDSTSMVGKATSIMVILLAGANLAQTYQNYHSITAEPPTLTLYAEDLKTRNRAQMLFVGAFKLIVFPLLGILIMYPCYTLGLVADPVLVFVMMMQFVTPSSLTLMIICNLFGYQEKLMSRLLVIQYAMGAVTMTVVIASTLYLLS